MLTFVFSNKTRDEALALSNQFCKSLVGIPGFIENEIVVSSSLIDSEGNVYPDGDSFYEVDGKIYNHVVTVQLGSNNQPEGTPDMVVTIDNTGETPTFKIS